MSENEENKEALESSVQNEVQNFPAAEVGTDVGEDPQGLVEEVADSNDPGSETAQPEEKAEGESPAPERDGTTSEEKKEKTLSRFARRERAAADELRTLVRDLLQEQSTHPLEETDRCLQLTLQIEVNPGNDWELNFTPGLKKQLQPQVEDVQALWGHYQEGAVFDFQSENAQGPECRPPDPQFVFAGYDTMGRPKWQQFQQILLDEKDPEVDRLFGKHAAILVRTQRGKDLREEQLGSYGRASKTYSILGQITMGYLKVPAKWEKALGGDRLALTFQVVETRDERGRFALRCNTLAGGLLPEELRDLLQEPSIAWVDNLRRGFNERLEQLQREANSARKKHDNKAYQACMARVPKLLRNFATFLEKGQRQKGRRTQHVEERKSSKQRPTHKALEDLAIVKRENAYTDLVKDTLVVLGKQGRAHVFSKEGKQVTSFQIGQDAVEMRVRTDRWRPVNDPEWAFLETLSKLT